MKTNLYEFRRSDQTTLERIAANSKTEVAEYLRHYEIPIRGPILQVDTVPGIDLENYKIELTPIEEKGFGNRYKGEKELLSKIKSALQTPCKVRFSAAEKKLISKLQCVRYGP